MQLEAPDRLFIQQELPSIEGWLLHDAACLTSALLRYQRGVGINGSIFEIGVYAGKYLSLLYHLTQGTDQRVLGLDTFQWYPREKVDGNFKRLFDVPDRLVLMDADSTTVFPANILETLLCKPRFISIDGAHTAPAVLSDLILSQELLADGGVVAVDDLLNPRAIGVSEGAYRYFLSPNDHSLAPFAYCANKLFATHRRDVEQFREATWQFTRNNPTLNAVIEFNKLLANGRHWVEQDLFGFPVVIV